MLALRTVALVFVGTAALWFNFQAAIHVEQAYAAACLRRVCPSIADDIYLLKVFAVLAALALPVALNRLVTWFTTTTGSR